MYSLIVYDWNYYFGLGPAPKPKLIDTFGQYRNQNHKTKVESNLWKHIVLSKVIIEKSHGEVSLMEQDTIENVF